MAYRILAPENSFVQFSENDLTTSCEFTPLHLCLPVYEEDDWHFQFVIEADTAEEADLLCGMENTSIQMGLVFGCSDPLSLTFEEKPERFRLSDYQVLYNWQNGMPGFADIIDAGDCFHIKIIIDESTEFCSSCFQRISDGCHTSVLEYSNDDNFAGFNYCNSQPVDTADTVCDPTIIQFPLQSTMALNYTASLLAKYGPFPTVEVWGYIGGELNKLPGVEIKFDAYPPTVINIDFGGPLAGYLKIKK